MLCHRLHHQRCLEFLRHKVGWNSNLLSKGDCRQCAFVWKRYLQFPATWNWLYLTVLRLCLSLIFFRAFIHTRPHCSPLSCSPCCLRKTWDASGGSHFRRFSFPLSSRARLPTGQGPIPIPDRASFSPSTAPPLQPRPPPLPLPLPPSPQPPRHNPSVRPSWIHSLKPSTLSPQRTM